MKDLDLIWFEEHNNNNNNFNSLPSLLDAKKQKIINLFQRPGWSPKPGPVGSSFRLVGSPKGSHPFLPDLKGPGLITFSGDSSAPLNDFMTSRAVSGVRSSCKSSEIKLLPASIKLNSYSYIIVIVDGKYWGIHTGTRTLHLNHGKLSICTGSPHFLYARLCQNSPHNLIRAPQLTRSRTANLTKN